MKKVFILDDDEDIINVMHRILSKQYELRTEMHADGIYERIMEFEPDLIFIDNFIGEKHSSDIIQHLRNSEKPVTAPVVLFSAAYNVEELAASIGAVRYLAKPASINDIRELVKSLIN